MAVQISVADADADADAVAVADAIVGSIFLPLDASLSLCLI